MGIRTPTRSPTEELGLRRGRAADALMLALPGAAYLYQGEELGLPEHTTLPDDVRQDPTWDPQRKVPSSAGTAAGCRSRGRPTRPPFGFSPAGVSWLPQPPSFAWYAVDRQHGVPDSTLELYRTMLRLRRELGLGGGELTWDDGSGARRRGVPRHHPGRRRCSWWPTSATTRCPCRTARSCSPPPTWTTGGCPPTRRSGSGCD